MEADPSRMCGLLVGLVGPGGSARTWMHQVMPGGDRASTFDGMTSALDDEELLADAKPIETSVIGGSADDGASAP